MEYVCPLTSNGSCINSETPGNTCCIFFNEEVYSEVRKQINGDPENEDFDPEQLMLSYCRLLKLIEIIPFDIFETVKKVDRIDSRMDSIMKKIEFLLMN